MRSTSALLEKGFSTKSKAPRLTAATAVGTSPWPVRKITGSTASRPASTSRSKSSMPLVPGMRTSSTRHSGASGQATSLRRAARCCQKASALPKPSDSSRRERSSQASASRTTSSSSTR